jgi:hypothetical protein
MDTAYLKKSREALGDISRGGLQSIDLSIVQPLLDKEATREGTRCV